MLLIKSKQIQNVQSLTENQQPLEHYNFIFVIILLLFYFTVIIFYYNFIFILLLFYFTVILLYYYFILLEFSILFWDFEVPWRT